MGPNIPLRNGRIEYCEMPLEQASDDTEPQETEC